MCKVTLYADDTAFYISSNDPWEIKQCLGEDMANLKKCLDYNTLTLNVKKTKFMHISGVNKKETFSDI